MTTRPIFAPFDEGKLEHSDATLGISDWQAKDDLDGRFSMLMENDCHEPA